MNALTEKALEIAVSQIGVRETRRNRGPEVDAYLIAAGLDPTKGEYPWCAAFVYWCFRQAAIELNVWNPCPKTAGGLSIWERSDRRFRVKKPTLGSVFVIDHGAGMSHVGFVETVTGTHYDGPSGNSNPEGGREGYIVCRYPRRPEDALGFLDFSRPAVAPSVA